MLRMPILRKAPVTGKLKEILIKGDENYVIQFLDNMDPDWDYFISLLIECKRNPEKIRSMPGGIGI